MKCSQIYNLYKIYMKTLRFIQEYWPFVGLLIVIAGIIYLCKIL